MGHGGSFINQLGSSIAGDPLGGAIVGKAVAGKKYDTSGKDSITGINPSVKGQGLTAPGGAFNTMLDPLDVFGGKKTGEAQQKIKQDQANQLAQIGMSQADIDAILNGSSQSGNGGQPSMGSYQPQPVLMPHLLQGPTDRQQGGNHMPLLAHQAFNQVLAPLQQPNWGVPQVNPAYLTGINRFPGGQVPDGNVQMPQGLGQPVKQSIQPVSTTPLNQRAWM